MGKSVVALVLAALPALAAAGPGVRFDTVVSESGQRVASPSVWVGFGEPAVIEVPGKIRVVASAQAPSGEGSLVQAEVSRFVDGQWVAVQSPRMVADISRTPSFELSIEGSPYRVVVMPRMATQPSSTGG